MSAKGECVFCKIRDGDLPARIVFEDDETVAFLDHRPLLEGHTLLCPKPHVETLGDLPVDRVGPLFVEARRLARAVERGLDAHGSFVAINNRISQSVPHLHVHVIPRWRRDGLFGRRLLWVRRQYPSEKKAEAVRKAIADAMGEE